MTGDDWTVRHVAVANKTKQGKKMEGQKDHKTKKCVACQRFKHEHNRLFIGLLFYYRYIRFHTIHYETKIK